VFDNTNNDFRLTTTEGAPAYGPIKKSLTTRGDTSPASALAVNRFPTAPRGAIHYNRTINFHAKAVARGIKNGKGVIVIHGIDYSQNGKYDFHSAGKSDLDPSLPADRPGGLRSDPITDAGPRSPERPTLGLRGPLDVPRGRIAETAT
jgi:hypothetical protein